MESNFEKILSYFRCCALCGDSFGSIDWLCKPCEKKFFEDLRTVEVYPLHKDFSVQYLFEWKPRDEDMKLLVHSLKGAGHLITYKKLATLFCYLQNFPFSYWDAIYYPCKGVPDHGSQWGQVFSEILGCRAYPLQPLSFRKQATLSKKERKNRSFYPLKPKGDRVLFVDDIVTTGSTALAAYKALGQPQNFAVWAMFYRRTL